MTKEQIYYDRNYIYYYKNCIALSKNYSRYLRITDLTVNHRYFQI